MRKELVDASRLAQVVVIVVVGGGFLVLGCVQAGGVVVRVITGVSWYVSPP